MFFYGKKVGYFSVYNKDEKVSSAGFVRISGEKEKVRITIQIKGANVRNGEYPLFLFAGKNEIGLGMLSFLEGKAYYEKCYCFQKDQLIIANIPILAEEIAAVSIKITENMKIEARWKPEIKGTAEKEEIKQQKEPTWQNGSAQQKEPIQPEGASPKKAQAEPENEKEAENAPALKTAQFEEQDIVSLQEDYLADKWGQLVRQFENVHPFGDDRLFLSIKLKDFIILREEYQKLIHNSFLLHGFYNYQHLILGKDSRIGSVDETCLYLGVPGVFFEREKMVAVMFGFEGFECEGPVETGKYGYYLRRVEI